MKSNNVIIRLENQVNNKIFPVKIYINDIEYCEGQEIVNGTVYLKSFFKTNEKKYNFEDDNTYMINFKARIFDKVLIGIIGIIIATPFFIVSTRVNLYPIFTALVFWGAVKLAYNPVVLRKNNFEIRKF